MLLPDATSRGVPRQRGAHAPVGALCLPEDTPYRVQKELGRFTTVTQGTMMHKLHPSGGYQPFLPI